MRFLKMKRIALDWFEASLKGTPDAIESFKNVFIREFNCKPSGSSRFYDSSSESMQGSVTIQYDLKAGLKNNPLSIRLTGGFFQDANAEFLFNSLIDLINEFGLDRVVHRVDSCIDSVSSIGDIEPMPWIKANKSKLQVKVIGDSETGEPETFFAGKGDFRMRLYNKLVENPLYALHYGLENEPLEVWRLESQLRGDSLKNVLSKENSADTYGLGYYQFYIYIGLSQLGRRFEFENLPLTSSHVSSYQPKTPTYHGKAQYWVNLLNRAEKELDTLLRNEVGLNADVSELEEIYNKSDEIVEYRASLDALVNQSGFLGQNLFETWGN